MTADARRPRDDDLVAENAALRRRVAEWEQRRAAVEAALKTALDQLEAARRAGKRPAAPFSKGPPKEPPRRPGQKAGHPPAHREKPPRGDRTVEVPLAHATCLTGGGNLLDHRVPGQDQVEIPPVQPIVTQFTVETARCAQGGERSPARHPAQTSDALGAAAVQIGPRALGLAAEFTQGLGVPDRTVEHVLAEALGLRVAPGTLARAGQRLAATAAPTDQVLLLTLRQEPLVNGDETGWKVAGRHPEGTRGLWVFTSVGLTVSTINPRRSHEVAERILGEDFAGLLTGDCFLADDAFPDRQHTCAGHLLRRCREMQADKTGAAAMVSLRVARLLRGAMTRRERRERLGEARYRRAGQRREAALDRLLDVEQSDPENARLVKLRCKHRAHLFTFLSVEGLAPTNNAAERRVPSGCRPAVVVRQTSGGNRSDRGARTHAVLTSVIRTGQKQGRDCVGLVGDLLRQPRPVALRLTSPASVQPPAAARGP